MAGGGCCCDDDGGGGGIMCFFVAHTHGRFKLVGVHYIELVLFLATSISDC